MTVEEVVDFLFPPEILAFKFGGGTSTWKARNTKLSQKIAALKKKLKENPIMTSILTTLLITGSAIGGRQMYLNRKTPSRKSRRKRKSRRR